LGESDGGGDGDHHEEESSGESGSPSPPRKGVPLTMREAEELARTTEALVLENKHLRAENKNMFFLFEENKDLREEVQVQSCVQLCVRATLRVASQVKTSGTHAES
jgi:hypothetical protein